MVAGPHGWIVADFVFLIFFYATTTTSKFSHGKPKVAFNLLFKANKHTLRANEKYLGATPGIINVFHIYGQDLTFHPHVHFIVIRGGFSKDEKWIAHKRKNGIFLFPRRAMEKIFKGYFLEKLQIFHKKGKLEVESNACFTNSIKEVACIKWNVYSKAPFASPQQIIEYLGRYTHSPRWIH